MKGILRKAVLLISLSVERGVPESVPDQFEFRRTIAIYHMVEGGGIIYKRPWEYYEKHGFIIVYEALDQYLAELENPLNKKFMQPGGLPVLDEFVFVNDVSQKTYVLKEYWLGDDENWVPMSHGDYMKLRSMIDDRRDLGRSITRTEALSAATAQIHKSAQDADSDYGWKRDAEYGAKPPAGSSSSDKNSVERRDAEAVVDNKPQEVSAKPDKDDGAGAEGVDSASIAEKNPLRDQSTATGSKEGGNPSSDLPQSDTEGVGNWRWGAAFIVLIVLSCCSVWAGIQARGCHGSNEKQRRERPRR